MTEQSQKIRQLLERLTAEYAGDPNIQSIGYGLRTRGGTSAETRQIAENIVEWNQREAEAEHRDGERGEFDCQSRIAHRTLEEHTDPDDIADVNGEREKRESDRSTFDAAGGHLISGGVSNV